MSSRQSSFAVVTLVPSSASERTRQILIMIEEYLRTGDDAVCQQFRTMPEQERIRALIAINAEAAKIEGMVDGRAKGDKQSPVEKMFLVYKHFIPQWIKKGAKPITQYQTMPRNTPSSAHPKRRAETDMRQSLLRAQMSRAGGNYGPVPQAVRATGSA